MRVYCIGFAAAGNAGKKYIFQEGQYHDCGGYLIRGPVCATKAAAAKHLAPLLGDADMITVDVVGGGGAAGSVVYEPIHIEEDGGETWGLFGSRAAAVAFMAAKKAASMNGGDDGEFTIWKIREHAVRGS